MNTDVLERAKIWLSHDYDQATRIKVQDLIDNNPKELEESFYRDLEFGTGGLRGIMGVGTNRMNEYTVAMATQGLANYLARCFKGEKISIAVAYDSRHNSTFFAEITANVFSANGIKVYLFDALRPTPELSFAVRHFECKSGVVITASHNPAEYNGYKVYWEDGAQIIAPHDGNIIDEVRKIKSINEVKRTPDPKLIQIIGSEIDKNYVFHIKKQSLSHEAIAQNRNMKIVYTPLHGTGVHLVPLAMADFGFNNLIIVYEQAAPDGAFPTVVSPNPEDKKTMEMALKKAEAMDAELVMATDPDADRVGIAVRNHKGDFVLLDGNQTGAILFHYMLTRWQELGKITGEQFTVKTVVTSELLKNISLSYQVPCFDVLTGFKYIAEIIRKNEGKLQYIVGGEESYGYLPGDYVRDKDAVASCCMIAEAAAWAKEQEKTLYELLVDIYLKYGFYKERLLSVTRKGKEGSGEIAAMMKKYRENPPAEVDGVAVIEIRDYKSGIAKNLVEGKESILELPKSDVIQLFLVDGGTITVRPSGTEPKIKFYFSAVAELNNISDFDEADKKLATKIERIINFLEIKP